MTALNTSIVPAHTLFQLNRAPSDDETDYFMNNRPTRLRLTPVADDDAPQLHTLWTAPGVRRYLFDGATLSPQQTAEMIGESRRLQRGEGTGLWVVRNRGDRLVGFAGYWYFRQPSSLELVYGVAEDAWGQGIATEATLWMMRHGFTALGFTQVVASTDAANVASVRVLEKVGMTLRQRATVDGLDTAFYAATREPWLSQQGFAAVSRVD